MPAAVTVLNEQSSKLALQLKPHKNKIRFDVRMASVLKPDFTPTVTLQHTEAHL